MIHWLYVNKSTGTYSETLEAFGLANIAIELMRRQGVDDVDATIIDKGYRYDIELTPGIDETNLEHLRDVPIFPIQPIPTDQYADKEPEGVPFVNWEAVKTYFDTVKAGSTEAVPPRNLDILLTINSEAIQGYNGLLFRLWNARHIQPEIFQIILQLYSDRHMYDVKAAIQAWKQLVKKHGELISIEKGWKPVSLISGQQIFSPEQGMGHNAVTMAATLNWRSKPKINFWLVEWLRAIGFYDLALPQLVGKQTLKPKDKDRKILVLQPQRMSHSMNSHIISKFRTTMLPDTAIRFDLFAVIRYLKILLTYFTDMQEEDDDFDLEPIGRIVDTTVAGFYVAFYKKMGQGRSLMNLSFIAFPSWIEVFTIEDVRSYLSVLDEIEKIVRQFDEDRSEDYTLLTHLRDFISGDDLEAFFRFTDAYGSWVMSKRHSHHKVKQLSYQFVERIIMVMKEDFTDVITNPGFQRIASAIRHATMLAQTRAASKEYPNYPYQVRYGLHQELLRKAAYPGDFIDTLSEFLAIYSAETNRVYELALKAADGDPKQVKIPGRRYNPSQDDIQAVIELMAKYGSRPVAKLLVACGTASTGKKVRQDNSNQQEND